MTSKEERKNCVDCRHCGSNGVCRETKSFIGTERSPTFASISRCGPSGKLWEPTKSVFRRLIERLFR